MRNKRTLQRGLSLLLAGGMALSSVGVTPVLAEEYTPAPETTQATPETAAQAPDDAALTEDDLVSAEEAQAEPATQQADEAAPIAVQADEQAEEDGLTQLIDEDFSNCTDNFGFASKAAVQDEALVLTNDSTGSVTVKKFDNVVAGQSKVHLNFDWKTNHTGKQGKAGIEFRDTYGRLLFTIASAYSENTYQLRYGTSAADSTFTNVKDSKNDADWTKLNNMTLNQYYNVDLTADFTAGTLHITITEPNGDKIVDEDTTTTAKNLAQMARCDYYSVSWANVIFTVDNFKLYGSNDAGEFPLEGKSIVAFGDSIVAGHKYTAASFVNFAADKEGMTVQKYAKNGATIMDWNDSNGTILSQINAAPDATPDYVVFDGGTNDATNSYLGTSNTDTAGATFAEAFRATITALQTKYPSAKLVYVAVHKMDIQYRSAEVQAEQHEQELAICKELGVTVANIYDDATLDASNEEMRNTYSFDSLSNAGVPQSGTDGAGKDATGTHPNFKAIEEFYVPTVTAALRAAKDTTTDQVEPDEPNEPSNETVMSVDFTQLENLSALENGWTIQQQSAGTVSLAEDPAGSGDQVLKINHDGTPRKDTGITFDGLDINSEDCRYVTVTEDVYLTTPSKNGQFCVPYLFNGNTVAYTLLVNGDWSTYKAHVGNSSTIKDAVAVTKNAWQTISYTIDLKMNTFSVSVDGKATALQDVAARQAVSSLTKLRIYSNDSCAGPLYVKNVSVKVEKEVKRPAHTAATTYYISNSGNDNADGKTEATAWATVKRASEETYIPGDVILFERGGVWNDETFAPQGSGDAEHYIRIASYGDTSKALPKIAANGKQPDALYLHNQEYWEIGELDISSTVEGCTMVAGDTNPTGNVTERVEDEGNRLKDLRGIHISGNDIASLKGFNIHNVRVHDVTGYVSWIGDTKLKDAGIKNNYGYDGSKRTGSILIESIAPSVNPTSLDSQYTVFSDITIADCEFVNNSFGGIIVKQYNNGKARNGQAGWANREGGMAGGMPDYYDANWHPHTNIVITGNYINQGASAYACNGIYLCGVKDSVVEKNVLEHIGTCGIELFYADNVAIQYNEISDVQKKGGGAGDNAIDPDWRATNILVQYNYVHDCGEGILLCGCQFNSGTVRYNLIQDVTRWAYIHYSTGGSGKFLIHNNVFYRTSSTSSRQFDGGSGGNIVSYTNNIFYDATGEGFKFQDCANYTNNAYYGTTHRADEKNPIELTESPFDGSAPDLTRKGNTATGALLEANGLQIKLSSGLSEKGLTKDVNGISLTDGLLEKGTTLNYSTLRESYDDTVVPITTKAYPIFEETGANATLNSKYTQADVNTSAPSVGMFERVLTPDDIILAGTVTDTVNTYPNVPITVTVGETEVKTTTNANGSFLIDKGLTAGEATVTAVVDGETYTATVTLEGGKSHNVTIELPVPQMPDPYPEVALSENFDDNKSDIFNFSKGAKFENGQLVLTGMGSYQSSYITFPEEIQKLSDVDIRYDFTFTAGSDKSGLQFRDSDGELLFATCVKTTDLRTSTTAEKLTDDSKAAAKDDAAEPKWTNNNGKTAGTVYTVRVHTDFANGKVSYQIKEKATGTVVVQQLNVDTKAKNLAKMYNCDWWAAKEQYIENFVLTTPDKKAEPVVVNKEALQQAVSEGEKKVEADYTTGSWKDFKAALEAAQKVLDKADATQEEVDDATAALTKAAKNLVAKADTSELEKIINDNKDKVEEDYTQASWKDFNDALEAAKAVLAKVDPTQEEVNAAADALTQAAKNLVAKADTSKLEQAINDNKDKVEEDYTQASWKDFNDALEAAKAVLAKVDPTQAEVDAAAAALTKAAEALETKPAPVVVDKKALQQAIEANADKVEDDYTEASWADFAKAFADAKTVLGKDDATQAEVDAAAKALTDAAAVLKVKPTETPKPDTVTKVDNEPLTDNNIPDSLKEAGYDTPEKIENKLEQESSQEFASDNLVVYDVTLKVSTDGGKTWQKATAENFPKDGLEVGFDLPKGITAETADQYTFLISHMKDDATVELLTPVLKDGKLTVTVHSLSPFGVSWKAKEQPKPSEQPTATPAPTAKPSNSSTTPKATAAPKATDAPKATATPAAPIPQTADSFPLVMLAVLALCSAAALAGLTICRSKKKR